MNWIGALDKFIYTHFNGILLITFIIGIVMCATYSRLGKITEEKINEEITKLLSGREVELSENIKLKATDKKGVHRKGYDHYKYSYEQIRYVHERFSEKRYLEHLLSNTNQFEGFKIINSSVITIALSLLTFFTKSEILKAEKENELFITFITIIILMIFYLIIGFVIFAMIGGIFKLYFNKQQFYINIIREVVDESPRKGLSGMEKEVLDTIKQTETVLSKLMACVNSIKAQTTNAKNTLQEANSKLSQVIEDIQDTSEKTKEVEQNIGKIEEQVESTDYQLKEAEEKIKHLNDAMNKLI